MNAATKEDEGISKQLAQQIEDLSIKDDLPTECAKCGKEVINPNMCNKCKAATYCNAACKKKHRKQHKTDCERRVAELYNEELELQKQAAELRDEELFRQPTLEEDCLICMLRLPNLQTGMKYKSCCGKVICSGCIYEVAKRYRGFLCPFCRDPEATSDAEYIGKIEKRIDAKDAQAIHNLGCHYDEGSHGLPQNIDRALELWHRASQLGHAASYSNIGLAYLDGRGVGRDKKKANNYYELAAKGGFSTARHNLGLFELQKGNWDRALKHYMIAVRSGNDDALDMIRQMAMNGDATKDDYTKAQQVYQAYLNEIKSNQRDQAAAFNNFFNYY